MSKQDLLSELHEALTGDASYDEVVEITENLVAADVDAMEAIDTASEAMHEIGAKFAAFEIFLPDLMIAGEKMKRCMNVLQPHIKATGRQRTTGRVVLGTVSGDLHDIGKNLVGTMLTVGGFDVVDLGVNVSPLDFVRAAREQKADIVALSSLMTASMPYQKEVIDLLTEMGQRGNHYIIVGGGPVTPEFAQEISADGWAENAASAVGLCEGLVSSGETAPVKTVIA
ncbi:B12-binding domain-containing protein [Chloroflexota bacterium]